jgi:hypothetical protein
MKRKRKRVGQYEPIPKQRLGGGAHEHLEARIYSHRRTRATFNEGAEPSARSATYIKAVLASQVRQHRAQRTFFEGQQRVRVIVVGCGPELVALPRGNTS